MVEELTAKRRSSNGDAGDNDLLFKMVRGIEAGSWMSVPDGMDLPRNPDDFTSPRPNEPTSFLRQMKIFRQDEYIYTRSV